ncbi:Arabinanase/levansucrase/invertase superfamily protein [Mycena indigotica]|uniref:Arabinanase/levansucrase/invertase superfamily protein n=1 Tax=Mycena indigotica TaxID=2126181 RepID=A0A8H6SE97_9AGAR|nr:Arabinanase/levansucrase/invertase superfamily protein [Mycena indigotica]KAF7297352.1 Arabinanase/levansucrase/invertase superfamily protein [Mycena indigotica]
MSVNQQSVLITGCTPGGIGFQLAKEYQSRGLRVLATARKAEVCSELISLGFEALEVDVTKIESVHALRDKVSQLTGGTLDVLVNNAGRSCTVPATDVQMSDVHEVFDTNLFGVMRMVQEFVPLLIASGDGRIVNIGSIAGVMPYPFGAVYNASKAALHAYGDNLRLELAPFNIQVITIVTGGVKSGISNRTLPISPTSLYAPIANIFVKTRMNRSQKNAMPTEAYARAVVAQSLRRSIKPWFWTGNFSYWCWFIDTFLPKRGFDWIFSWEFGLSALKKIVYERRQKRQS